MTEAEVSLRLALYYIRNHLTEQDVRISIDGAQIKTGETIHFDIKGFLKDNSCTKMDGDSIHWQGTYCVAGQSEKIILDTVPGCGDIRITLKDGKILYVESKKSKRSKSSQEYRLMREAIGQLMTSCLANENTIPCVAVPYTKKSLELAERWSKLEQIQKVGIKFILIQEDGNILTV